MFTDWLKVILNKRNPAEFLLLIGLGLVGLYAAISDKSSAFQNQFILIGGLIPVMAGSAAVLYGYLQDVRRRTPRTDYLLKEELDFLSSRVVQLDAKKSAEGLGLSVVEKANLLREIKESASKETADQLAGIWRREFEEKYSDEHNLKFLFGLSQDVVSRLQEEVYSLGRRANLNLTIGILISALGLGVLTWFVVAATQDLTAGVQAVDAALRFGIRFTLAAFIQLFAYFFLRLYRYSIFEIKYFQNEITGAQFRLLGLIAAIHQKDQKAVEKIAIELVKTERNFVLKKGETTISNQRDLMEQDYDNRLSKTLDLLLNRQTNQHSQ